MAGFLRSYGWLTVWILLNVAVFVTSYRKYLQPQYFHVHSMIGSGLCVSRGSAAVVNLSATLVLLPVCRALNSQLFRALGRLSRPLLAAWLARLRSIHSTLAITILTAGVIHSAAHLINSVNFSRHYNSQYPEINWAKYKGQSPVLIVLTTPVGLTGLAMLIILLLMCLLSLQCVRTRHYHLFWATHFLFLPFLVCLILHPLSGVLKEQNNYTASTTLSRNNASLHNNQEISLHIQPTFSPMECQGWRFVLMALGVFSVDSMIRLCRRNKSGCRVTRVVTLPAGATRITLYTSQPMHKHFHPGQYILLQCPWLSSLEWHPFTITSMTGSSSSTSLTVLVRQRGDWTKALCKMLMNNGNDRIMPHYYTPARLLVDGPYSSPMENVLKSRIAICIAAGIGVTPFLAVLQYLYTNNDAGLRNPRRLHLVWVMQTADQLSWSGQVVSELHHKLWNANQPDRFEFQIYVTRSDSKRLLKLNPTSQNLLETRIHLGRPNWKEVFSEWASQYHKKRVSVFICGSSGFNKQVQATADTLNKSGHRFTCYHEAFS